MDVAFARSSSRWVATLGEPTIVHLADGGFVEQVSMSSGFEVCYLRDDHRVFCYVGSWVDRQFEREPVPLSLLE
jgi:hypothetical protein